MRRFSLFQRSGNPVFYAQIKNPETGSYLPPKSTGKREESEAFLVVADWLQNGIPEGRTRTRRSAAEAISVDTILYKIREARLTESDAERIVNALKKRGLIESAKLASEGPENELLVPFLERFWDYDTSPYVREKLKFGHSIGRRHCYEQTSRIQHWKNHFPEDTRLKDLSRDALVEFQLALKDRDLASKTVNAIVSVGTVALNWLTDRGDIPSNPAKGLRKLSGKSDERGILTMEEARNLFTVPWSDERARVANLVGMTTGLRSGEVRALRRHNIGKDRLYVNNAWGTKDGLKGTKNGEDGEVPLLPLVRDALLALADTNPHGPEGFIFYHVDSDKPCDGEVFRKGLVRAYVDASLSPEDQKNKKKREKAAEELKKRNVGFHSWRHFYATHLANRVEMRTVALATRHKTEAMAEHYASHKQDEHFRDLSAAVAAAFRTVGVDPA